MGKWKDEIIGRSVNGMMRKRVNGRMEGRENGKILNRKVRLLEIM